MRRRLSSIISVLLAMLFVMNMAVSANDEEDHAYGVAEAEFLRTLGIVDISEDKLGNDVSNDDFAGIAAVVGGISKDRYSEGLLDMLVGTGRMPAVCSYPNRTITFAQAVKTFLSVLGFDMQEEKNGGYPGGYITTAGQVGILSGIKASGDDNLTYAIAARLIYNILDCEITELDITLADGTIYRRRGGTVAELVFDIYKGSGRMTANTVTSMSDPDRFTPESVMIESVEYECADSSFDKFLGRYIDFRYKYSSSEGPVLLYAACSKTKDRTVEINDENRGSISGGRIYYSTAGGRQKTAAADDGCCIIFNGRVSDKALSDFDGTERLLAQLTDTDGNGKYDIINIRKYETVFVGKISSYGQTVYDKYDPELFFSFDPEENDSRYLVVNENGDEVLFSALKAGDVLSVMMSEDGKLAEARLCRSSKSDVIRGYSADDYDTVISVGDSNYSASDSFASVLGSLELGVQYDIYFDVFGRIAGALKSSDSFRAAMIVKTILHEDDSSGDMAGTIRLFELADSSVHSLELAGKLTVDGVFYKNAESAYAALFDGSGKLKSRLIRYRVNGDNEIINIDTAYYNKAEESDETLQFISDSEPKSYERESQMFYNSNGSGFVCNISASTYVVYAKDDPEDETEYSIIPQTTLATYSSFSEVTGYSRSTSGGVADYIVMGLTASELKAINNTAGDSILFDSVSEVWTDDGLMYNINGWDLVKNAKYTQTVEDASELSASKRGDIINLRVTYSGRLGNTVMIYKSDSGVNFSDIIGGSGGNASSPTSFRWIWGKAFLSGNGFIYVLKDSRTADIANAALENCEMVPLRKKTPVYYVYDKKGSSMDQILTKVSAEEVNDYISGGANADNVLVYARHSQSSVIIIFR